MKNQLASKQMPYVFIGSSAERMNCAEALQLELGNRDVLTKNWGQNGVFEYGKTNLENLIKMSKEFNFACFFVNDDDIKISRGAEQKSMRDNILFEIGLFIGVLGLEKVFIISARGDEPELPSDLEGISPLTYPLDNDLSYSLSHTAVEIRKKIKDFWGAENNFDLNNLNVCDADIVVNQQNSVVQNVSIDNTADTSNLFFLFLNVEDCEKSRFLLTEIFIQYEEDIFVEAVYDVLGSWDVVIKFRSSKEANKFRENIVNKLIKHHQMSSDLNKKFSKFLLIDVKRQSKNIKGLIRIVKNEKIIYKFLKNSDDYNKYRASKAFLWMEAKGSFGSKIRKKFLEELSSLVNGTKGEKIIESVCESNDEILIETFSGCSQNSFINRINKDVEKITSTHQLDKTNLICYNYKEDGLNDTFNEGT